MILGVRFLLPCFFKCKTFRETFDFKPETPKQSNSVKEIQNGAHIPGKSFTPRVVFPFDIGYKRCIPAYTVRHKTAKVQHFQYQALPFGLALAPRIFTQIMAEVMQEQRLK